MNIITTTEIANIYEQTTIILGIASLVMSITLFTLRKGLKNNGIRSYSGLIFLSIALFMLSVINLSEYITGIDDKKEQHSLSVVIFAASIELFLMFAAYMSMLYTKFTTRARIYFEMGCIAIFTTPPLFVSPDNHPLLFNILFTISITFYCVKFVCNYIEYRKQMIKTKEKVDNMLSDDSNIWLKWINSTFYVVLAIGSTSVIAPMTNLKVLVFYNSFIILAYFYIYILVVSKIVIFDKSMSILDNEPVTTDNDEQEIVEEFSSPVVVSPKPAVDFMDSRQKLLDEWIANRGYAVAGITATEVATHLKTNRTRLSYYLKNSLNTTYYEWIAKLRIEDAKRQLIEYPDRTIYEIALSVGIEDRDNFRRVFQKLVGVSPTTYRKQESSKIP